MEAPKEIKKGRIRGRSKCGHFPDFSYSASSKIIISDVPSRKDHICHPHELGDHRGSHSTKQTREAKKEKEENKNGSTREMINPHPRRPARRGSPRSQISRASCTPLRPWAKGDWGIEKLGDTLARSPPRPPAEGEYFGCQATKEKVRSREKKMSKEKSSDPTKESRPPDFISISASKNISGEVPEGIKAEPLTPTEDALPPTLSDTSLRTVTVTER